MCDIFFWNHVVVWKLTNATLYYFKKVQNIWKSDWRTQLWVWKILNYYYITIFSQTVFFSIILQNGLSSICTSLSLESKTWKSFGIAVVTSQTLFLQ